MQAPDWLGCGSNEYCFHFVRQAHYNTLFEYCVYSHKMFFTSHNNNKCALTKLKLIITNKDIIIIHKSNAFYKLSHVCDPLLQFFKRSSKRMYSTIALIFSSAT